MTNPITPKPPCPFCGEQPAHDLTLRLQCHITTLQQQIEGLTVENVLLQGELAWRAPPTEEADLGRAATEIGLSSADADRGAQATGNRGAMNTPALTTGLLARALALMVLDKHGYLNNKWAVVRLLKLEFNITQTAAEDVIVQAARERKLQMRTGEVA